MSNTNIKNLISSLPFLAAFLQFGWSCNQETQTNQQALTSLSKEIKEIRPGILEGGKQFDIGRKICNVHCHSNVVTGRMMGAAAVAILHSNTDFLIDKEAAKAEIIKLKSNINL